MAVAPCYMFFLELKIEYLSVAALSLIPLYIENGVEKKGLTRKK